MEEKYTKEYILSNGISGYSSSTICGLNKRKYHGLLVSDYIQKRVIISRMEEEIVIDGKSYILSNVKYNDALIDNTKYIKEAIIKNYVQIVYEVEGLEITKTIFLPYLTNSFTAIYEIKKKAEDKRDIKIVLKPLIADRDVHSLVNEEKKFKYTMLDEEKAHVRVYLEKCDLDITVTNSKVYEKNYTYYENMYEEEKQRGFEYIEKLFAPLEFVITPKFEKNKSKDVFFATLDHINMYENELEILKQRDEQITKKGKDEFEKNILRAGDTFNTFKDDRLNVLAGYPWFESWNRDTLISFEGLFLSTGNFKMAKKLLEGIMENAKAVAKDGIYIIPNTTFGKEVLFNSVDASLLYFEAVYNYVKMSKEKLTKEMYVFLKNIYFTYLLGTNKGNLNISVDKTMLLSSGSKEVQVTWMDAKIGNEVITPREGNAVEINAMWYNALNILKEFALENSEMWLVFDLEKRIKLLKNAFKSFYIEKRGLKDTLCSNELRPNQLFALSLSNTKGLISEAKAKEVLEVVEKNLVSKYGLQTLDKKDPKYIDEYSGDSEKRDRAYHQGIVWPWLSYIYYKGLKRYTPKKALAYKEEYLKNVRNGMKNMPAFGTIPEVCNAKRGYKFGGCVSQAWSVASVIYMMLD